MEAGYRRDRDAQAKSLKIAIKNKKKDSVLYGAVIKMESLYPSRMTNADTQTLSSTSSSTQTPLNERREVALLDATVSPMDSASQPTSPIRVGTSSFPFGIKKKTPSEISNAKSIPIRLPSLIEELTKMQKSANRGLRPVDSRQSNVSVGSTPRDTTPITPPVIAVEQLESKAPTPINAARDRTISTAITDNSSDTSSNTATATAGTYTDRAMETEGDLRKVESKPVPVVNVRDDPKIQAAAEALFELAKNDRIRQKQPPNNNSLTFTPFRSDGTIIQDHRISMMGNKPKNGSSWYGFQGKHTTDKKTTAIKQSPLPDGYDLIVSMREAKNKIILGDYRPEVRMGEMNGLGVAADHIGSARVIFKDNKGTSGVAKGQVYVMRPQLIKGHVRLYNRSGRPIVSRSTVSPQFQRLVRDIVERNTFEADDYSNIDPKEAADVNSFITATKPIQPRNIDRLSNADTIYQLKKRYEVLVGELSAGNTGKLVRDEMETILRSLIRMNSMNSDKGRELIRSLRAF